MRSPRPRCGRRRRKYDAQRAGCPLSALLGQLGLAGDRTQEVVAALYRRWHGHLADGVEALRTGGGAVVVRTAGRDASRPAAHPHRLRAPRDVRIAALVMGGSAAGDLAAQAALTLRLHAETGTATAVSALLLANTLPVLLCVPVAGRLADRVDSRRLLVGCSLTCAALCAGLAAARPTWLVLTLVAAVAAVSAVTTAGLGALVPVMAGPGGVVRANTALRGAMMVMSVAGLAVGGAGSQWLGTGPVLVLDAVSFVAVAIGAAVIRARRAGGRPVSRAARPDRAAGSGPAGPLPRWTVAGGYAAVLLLVSTTNVAQVFFVKDTLGADDLGYGLVSACWALGALLALPLVRHTRPDPDLLARLTIVGMTATGAALVGCGALAGLAGTAALYVLAGAAACVMQVTRGSYVQLTADPEHRGRQLARYNAVTKAASVGALLLGGPLVDAVGGRATYVLAGSAAAAVAGVAALTWVRVGAGVAAP